MKKYLYKIGIWPLRLYWFLFRPQTFGAICVVRNEGKILFICHTYGKSWWSLPGGGIKKNELPEEAARREVLEETGLLLVDIRKIGEFLTTREYKKDTVYIFLGEAEGREVRKQNAEISDYGWYSVDELPAPLSTISKKALSLMPEHTFPFDYFAQDL